jgi:Acetyltransferase (GNAT) domain
MSDCATSDPAFLPFPQTAAYAQAAGHFGARLERADLGCGTALIVERRGMRLITRGPVWTGGTAADHRRALRRLARWPGVTVATPEVGLAGFGLIPLVTAAHHAIWNLRPEVAELRAGLAGKWRNRLVAAERSGLRTGQGGAREWATLITAETGQREARGYRALPAAFSAVLPMDARRTWVWRQGGQVRAAMGFIVEGGTASYHLGWADAAARAAGAHGVMLWQAACALRAEGVRWLDLGLVNDEAAPGLARFKLGTGAALRALGATMLVLPG